MKAHIVFVLSLSLVFMSCNSKKDSSPVSSGTTSGTVSIQSTPYTNDGSVALFMNPTVKKVANLFLIPSSYAATVTDFQFCITKMKIVSSVGGAPGTSQEAILGLIDVSDPTVIQTWGDIQIAEGAAISELHLEVHRDPENCSAADFSVSYNGTTLNQDLEFKFKFDPAITANHGDTLSLGLSSIAKAMEDASLAGQFNDQQITTFIEAASEGTGEEL